MMKQLMKCNQHNEIPVLSRNIPGSSALPTRGR
jgi:hypothetical protein